jgi:hypothetical protein
MILFIRENIQRQSCCTLVTDFIKTQYIALHNDPAHPDITYVRVSTIAQ